MFFFTIRVECCNFLNLYGPYVLRYESFFYNFLHIDTTCRSKINSDQKRLFLSVSLYPLSFFVNTPFKIYLKFTLGLLKVYLRFTTQNLLEVYSRFIGGLLKVCLKFNQRMKLTQGSKFTQGLKLTLKV